MEIGGFWAQALKDRLCAQFPLDNVDCFVALLKYNFLTFQFVALTSPLWMGSLCCWLQRSRFRYRYFSLYLYCYNYWVIFKIYCILISSLFIMSDMHESLPLSFGDIWSSSRISIIFRVCCSNLKRYILRNRCKASGWICRGSKISQDLFMNRLVAPFDTWHIHIYMYINVCHHSILGLSFKTRIFCFERFKGVNSWRVHLQNKIGADIIMALDDVVKTTTTGPRVEEAMHRTLRWIDRCISGPTPISSIFNSSWN